MSEETNLAIEHLRMAELSARAMDVEAVTVMTKELALALAEIERLQSLCESLADDNERLIRRALAAKEPKP